MSYQVIARKWRPQTLDELVGQEHISLSLKNAIQSNRIAHAYLFSGPRGVGKTSTARIFAKSIICEDGPSESPCQKCSNCVEISNGNSYDVLEIDGASNRGIDQIRELKDNVKYLPNKSRHKIYIIDEVHMLTDQAFNALLKTLEEPPSHIIFIFATTEPHKVKITIRSRCQHYHFKRIPTSLIQKQLDKIVRAEKLSIEEKALFQIAKAGDGSMRDSQSLLDQVIAYSDKDITIQKVEEILSVFSEENYFQFLNLLVEKDILRLLGFLSSLIEAGDDLPHFSLGLIEQFRNILILKKGGATESKLLNIPSETIQKLTKYSDHFSDHQLLEIINLLISLNQELKKAINHKYLFESCLYRIVDYENFIQPSEILKRLEIIESSTTEKSPHLEVEELKTKVTKQPTKSSPDIKKPISPTNKKSDQTSLPNDFWNIFISALTKDKPFLAAYLNETKNVKLLGDKILVTFEDSLYHEAISKSENRVKMDNLLFQIFKKKLNIQSVLKPKEKSDKNESNNMQEAISSVVNSFKGEIISED